MKYHKKLAAILVSCQLLMAFTGCSSTTTTTPSTDSSSSSSTDAGTADTGTADTGSADTESDSGPVEAEYVFRLADTLTEVYPATAGAIAFAELVEEYSEGRIVVEVYTGGVLGSDEAAVVEQLQFGGIDIARLNISPVAEVAPMLNLLQMPFLFSSTDHMHEVIDSQIGTDMLASVDGTGMVGLCLYEAGARNIYNSVRPITSLEDLQGLKIRVPNNSLMLDTFNALGASATALSISEVYSSLQTGVVDGAENNNPSYQQMSHFEVAPYLTMNAHTAPPEVLAFSEPVFQKLSAEDQEIIRRAALESVDVQRAVFDATEQEALDIAIAGGIEIVEEIDRAPFVAAVEHLYEKYAGDYMDVLAQIQAMG